jgi:hypothetical protein
MDGYRPMKEVPLLRGGTTSIVGMGSDGGSDGRPLSDFHRFFHRFLLLIDGPWAQSDPMSRSLLRPRTKIWLSASVFNKCLQQVDGVRQALSYEIILQRISSENVQFFV